MHRWSPGPPLRPGLQDTTAQPHEFLALLRRGPLLLLRLLVLLGTVLLTACGPKVGQPPTAALALVPLRLTTASPDVEIYLDGEFRGELDRWNDGTLPVTPGSHRLELRAPGHYPLQQLIEVGPAGASFRITLCPIPPGLE